MKLSIIIPCYNEEQTIKPLLDRLYEVDFPIEREIIVIDDGSSRDHSELIKEEIISKKVKFIRLSKNQGKGVAIRVGLRYAEGDIFIIQDADFEYFPSDIPRLLNPILQKKFNIVYGSRFIAIPPDMSKVHFFGNNILNKLTNFLYKSNITDMETGYKIFTRKALNKIKINAKEFEFEPEFTAKILLLGYKIKELPIKYKPRNFGKANINLFDGIESALILIKYRYFNNSKIYQFFLNIFKSYIKKLYKKFIVKIKRV